MARRCGSANLAFSMKFHRDKGERYLSARRTWERRKPGVAASAPGDMVMGRDEAGAAMVRVGTGIDACGHFDRVGLVSGSKPWGRTV
jgi:hypothetical protein